MNLAQAVIREPAIRDVPHYRKRVWALTWIFVLLFGVSLGGMGIVVARVKLFVTLAQRSNVETLTLAFLFLFFGYVSLMSAAGAWGAAQILWYGFSEHWRGGRPRSGRGCSGWDGPGRGRGRWSPSTW